MSERDGKNCKAGGQIRWSKDLLVWTCEEEGRRGKKREEEGRRGKKREEGHWKQRCHVEGREEGQRRGWIW